jgi:hypothetical protein
MLYMRKMNRRIGSKGFIFFFVLLREFYLTGIKAFWFQPSRLENP